MGEEYADVQPNISYTDSKPAEAVEGEPPYLAIALISVTVCLADVGAAVLLIRKKKLESLDTPNA